MFVEVELHGENPMCLFELVWGLLHKLAFYKN